MSKDIKDSPEDCKPASPDMVDRVTILRAKVSIRKVIRFAGEAWSKAPSPLAKHYGVEVHPIDGLDAMRRVLEAAARTDNAVMIHGAPKPDIDRRSTLRRKVHFAERAHRFLMLDLDKLEDMAADPAEAAAQARDMLPPEFRGVRCLWNATAGHNLKPGHARLRLILWLSAYVTLDEVDAWMRDCDAQPDRSVWRVVQPIYLGVEVVGAPDPVAQRWGMLDGAPEVAVPADLSKRARIVVGRATPDRDRNGTSTTQRSTTIPAGVTPDAPHMIVQALGLLGQRKADRIARDGRRLSWFNVANDFLDRALSEDTSLAIVAAWAFPDNETEAELRAALAALAVPDAADHARKVRQRGEALADTWASGDALDLDDVERMVGDAVASRTSPIGAKFTPPTGDVFGEVDEDMGVAPGAAVVVEDPDDDGKPATCWADVEIGQIVDAILFGDDAGLTEATVALLARPEATPRAATAIQKADFTSPKGVRAIKKLLARIRKQADLARKERTEVSINVVQIHASAELIVRTLRRRSVDMFVRGGQLVEVVEGALPLPGVAVQAGAILKPVTRTGLFATVSEHVKLLAGAEGKEREVEPPRKITDVIFENPHKYPLRPILRVSEGPMLLKDGTIISAQGYDAATASYITKAIDLPPIPDRPTRADALAALAELDGLLDGFEFASPASRSATVAAMLATTCRNLFDVVPATLFTAPMPGSGKSYLYRLISALALGRTGALMAAGRDEAETEKRLDSLLAAGVAVMCIDNLNGTIGGDKLCQIVEQPQIEIRPLGSTARLEFQNAMSVFLTGNNAALSTDMVRRTTIVRLDPATDRPESRTFAFSPLAMVEADRPRYLRAAFVIMRAWQVAQAEGAKPVRPGLASFEAWNDGVRSALLWLGQADPLATLDAGREMDPERQKAGAIFPAWRAAFGEADLTVSELEKAIMDAEQAVDGEVPEVRGLAEALRLHMPAERRGAALTFGRRLGYFLRPLKGRVSGDLRLESVTLKDRQGWRVVQL